MSKQTLTAGAAWGFHRHQNIPPTLYFVVSAVFHYLGPAFAVLLFAKMNVLGVAWLRIATAAFVLGVWTRPWRHLRSPDRDGQWLIAALGLILGCMNVCFYLAIQRLPLATVGTIEFLGPIGIAAWGARTQRNVLALILAVTGVFFMTHVSLRGDPEAYLFAFSNCLLFMGYILLGHRIAAEGGRTGVERLSAAMLVAVIVVTPICLVHVGPALLRPKLLLAGIGVGVCSSVIPYVCDQLAMARLSPSTFALLLALLPATASILGVIVLRQIPAPTDITGVALVMAGVGFHRTTASTSRRTDALNS